MDYGNYSNSDKQVTGCRISPIDPDLQLSSAHLPQFPKLSAFFGSLTYLTRLDADGEPLFC